MSSRPELFDPSESRPTVFRFSRFEFRPGDWLLHADGQALHLQQRTLQVLHVLLQHAGSLVEYAALYDAVWGIGCVEDHNLTVHVGLLKKAIGKACIYTVKKHGYRFDVPVWRLDSDGVQRPHPAEAVHAAAWRAPGDQAWQPVSPAPMLGRERDLAALCSALSSHSLVCLVGASGAGKTLLARHVAHRRREAHVHGCCWVDLQSLEEARGLPGVLAAALALPESSGASFDRVVAAVANLDALLVLDGADRVGVALASMLDRICATAQQLRVLVTCQAPLPSVLAQLHRLGGLATPPDAHDPQAARASAAVALFMHRAQALDSQFVLPDDKLPDVVALCHALDGHALAVLLAAGRVHGLGLSTLTSSLAPRLKLLGGGRDAGLPERHRSVLAALDWSHAQLDSAEQRIFRRMAVLTGPAPLALLEAVLVETAVLDDSRTDRTDGEVGEGALDVLDRLVDRSLVARTEDATAGLHRYRLLQIPRAYALQRLTEAGELDAMCLRHARALEAQIESVWSRPDDGWMSPDAWHVEASALLDEALAAFSWARDTQEVELALRLGAFVLRACPRARKRARLQLAANCQMLLLKRPLTPPALAHRVCVQLARCWLPDKPELAASAAHQSLQLAQVPRAADATESSWDADWRLHQSWALVCLSAASMHDQATSDRAPAEKALAEQAMAALQAISTSHWPPLRRAWRTEAEAALARLRSDGQAHVNAAQRRLALVQAAGGQGLTELQALMDAQLQADLMVSAADTGGRILALGQAGRNDFTLARARIGVFIALLAQGRLVEARAEVLRGFECARLVDLHVPWIDQFSLLAALDGQHPIAAKLIGWSDNQHAALDLRRDPQARRATLQARQLVLQALGDNSMAQEISLGGRLAEMEIAALVMRSAQRAAGDDAASG